MDQNHEAGTHFQMRSTLSTANGAAVVVGLTVCAFAGLDPVVIACEALLCACLAANVAMDSDACASRCGQRDIDAAYASVAHGGRPRRRFFFFR